MKPKINTNLTIFCFLILLFCPTFLSCNKNTDIEPPISEESMKRVMLVYAVNNSSLKYDFKSDSTEIKSAMKNVDLRYFQVLVYKTVDRNTTALYKFVKKDGKDPVFEEIKTYPRQTTSTAPQQINNVIKDALELYPKAVYDLIFWGHGTAWRPENNDTDISSPSGVSGMEKAYGGEYNGNTTSSGMPVTCWTNIDDLADAIPDHVFDHIWFDCCYMSSIEVIYQFRNKCNVFVGYPTEVMSEGMAYDYVLPFMVRENPDVVGAAETFIDRYINKGQPATVAVLKMDRLEGLAEAVRNILVNSSSLPEASSQINYSRMSACMLVDLMSFCTDMANLNGHPELADQLEKAYNDCVLYSAASKMDFRNKYWDTERIFGISTYYFQDYGTEISEFYKTLDWYRRAYN